MNEYISYLDTPQLCLYIINMFEYLLFNNCILFADDTTIYVIGRNLKFLKAKLQSDLNNLAFWLLKYKLALNVNKTKSMLFCPKTTIIFEYIDLCMHSQVIENVEKFKFLGIWLDHHLEWYHHLQVTLNRIAQNTYMIKRLFHLLPTNLLTNLYHAHINSHILYGFLIWGSMLNCEQMSFLVKSQSNCLKHIQNAKIMGVKKMLVLEMCKFMYNYSNGQLPKSLMNGFEKSTHGYPTRNCNIPTVPIHRSAIYNNS